MTLIHKSFIAKSHRSLGLEMAKWLNGREIVNSVTNGCKVTLYVEGNLELLGSIVRNPLKLEDVMTPELRLHLAKQIEQVKETGSVGIFFCLMRSDSKNKIEEIWSALCSRRIDACQYSVSKRDILFTCNAFLFRRYFKLIEMSQDIYSGEWSYLDKEKLDAL